MDLDEIQAVWSEMSDQLEKQKKLTTKIILDMTQERYTKKFRKISTYETIGAVMCFASALVILFNLSKLDTWYLMLCGILTLVIMLVLPILSLRSIAKIKGLNVINANYKETIVAFSKAKKNFLMIQQFAMYLSLVIMFTSIPVASKILSNKDFFMIEKGPWYYVYLIAITVLVVFFSRWGYGCYKNITKAAETIVKELES